MVFTSHCAPDTAGEFRSLAMLLLPQSQWRTFLQLQLKMGWQRFSLAFPVPDTVGDFSSVAAERLTPAALSKPSLPSSILPCPIHQGTSLQAQLKATMGPVASPVDAGP